MKKTTWIGIGLAALLAIGAGYALTHRNPSDSIASTSGAPAPNGGAASGVAGPPVSVTTVKARQRDVNVQLEATGTVAALNSVDIRPQVSSTIRQVHIREGQSVSAGQLLFTLDARNDEVNVTRAKAQLAKDNASLADAQRQLARSKDLFAQNFISQGAVDTNQTLVDSQQAVIAADRAAIDAAQVGLSYTRISAPAAGRAGAINVFAGSTVQPGGAALVTITQLDPIAVAFNLPQRDLGSALDSLKVGGGAVRAVLPEGRGSRNGKLQFVDNAVDPSSGTVRVKAQFENHNNTLWPGAFVTVQLAVRTIKDAIVVPQAAIIQAPRGKIVYIVDGSGKANARPVELVYASGEDAVVGGVKVGERVVVEGRQNLRPGSSVIERAPDGDASKAKRGVAASSTTSSPVSSPASMPLVSTSP